MARHFAELNGRSKDRPVPAQGCMGSDPLLDMSVEQGPDEGVAMPDRVRECYLISCVGQKAAVPMKAADLYTSDWFKKARRYVEATSAPWFILSAEYGLVHPETRIGPYEKTLNQMGVSERRAWAKRVIAQMDAELPPCDEIFVFAGARYREFLIDYLRGRAREVVVPLQGLRIGEQLSWFGEHAGKPGHRESLC